MKTVRIFSAAICALCALATSTGAVQASSPDASWLKTAASANKCEIKAAQLAENRASDPQWKSFASQMLTDHQGALAGIQGLAAAKSITLSSSMAPADAAQISTLSHLRGASFDKAYSAFAVNSHAQANALYNKEIASGQDSDVRALAAKQLPVVQNHLTMADKMTGMSMNNLSPGMAQTASGKM